MAKILNPMDAGRVTRERITHCRSVWIASVMRDEWCVKMTNDEGRMSNGSKSSGIRPSSFTRNPHVIDESTLRNQFIRHIA
jgi:hypothetical protein